MAQKENLHEGLFEAKLFCWTLNAKDGVPVGFREKMDLPLESRKELLRKLFRESAKSEESGILYLSTCHRVELFGYDLNLERLSAAWQSATSPFLCRAKFLSGKEVLQHMFKVSSSLESEVLGETQITGQVKEASALCKEWGLLKGPLERCLQKTHRCNKRVRAETQLGTGTVSVAHVAVDGLFDVFESLENKRALVVGAGPMALQALERVQKKGIGKLTWINRSREKLLEHPLALSCEIAHFEQLQQLSWNHDVIILATASPRPLLDRKGLKALPQIDSDPQDGPRVVLDLGHPRNASEDLHGYRGFFVRNVDEFRDKACKNTELRQLFKQKALEIVDDEVSKLLAESRLWERGPIIGQLSKALEDLLNDELLNLKLEKTPEIVYFSRNVHGKLLHRILQKLDDDEGTQSLEFLKTLVNAWRQKSEWPQKNQLNPLLKSLPPEALRLPHEALTVESPKTLEKLKMPFKR